MSKTLNKVFVPPKVKYQHNRDFVKNLWNKCKTCLESYISCHHHGISYNNHQSLCIHITWINVHPETSSNNGKTDRILRYGSSIQTWNLTRHSMFLWKVLKAPVRRLSKMHLRSLSNNPPMTLSTHRRLHFPVREGLFLWWVPFPSEIHSHFWQSVSTNPFCPSE
jgi:hypothetical protein